MNKRLLLAIIILLMTAVAMVTAFMDWIEFGSFVGPYRISHWMSWIGALFISIYAPIFYFLRRRHPEKSAALLDVHVFGFLISFLLISIHFAGQMSRPELFFPDLGEGIALYIVVILLVVTGLIQGFGLASIKSNKHYTPRFNRYLHTSLVTAFYVIIIVHVMAGLNII